MRKFFTIASVPFNVIVLISGGATLLLHIARQPEDLGGFAPYFVILLLIGAVTGVRVFQKSEEALPLKILLSISSALGMIFLLPLIGLGGCCLVIMSS